MHHYSFINLLSLLPTIFSCAPAIQIKPAQFAAPTNEIAAPPAPPGDLAPLAEDYAWSDIGTGLGSGTTLGMQKDTVIHTSEAKSRLQASLFDLFRPLKLASFTTPSIQQQVQNSKLHWNLTVSPPIHWTFCEPTCGVDNQAVDPEDAKEVARDDIVEAYNPHSILLEAFGNHFGSDGYRYRTNGKTVAHRISLQKGAYETFSQNVTKF
ncbi:hypothetical protein WR25_03412 [Diploscapter pachys]|uniref:Uncharacterized protein n=1 Tax=Diploscapter pachys TaxID=2018661 RepID=A0A2A2LTI2_9BILA|nr:hypothetical protein WR25_03412 [Diploscapter pachys]